MRGWDASPSDRDIRIRPVMVTEGLTRTDWLNELRDLASSRAIALSVAGEYRQSVRPTLTAPWRPAACAAAASSSFRALMTQSPRTLVLITR